MANTALGVACEATHQQDLDTASAIMQYVMGAIAGLKVCNTSPSPAGRKVQTRLTWAENGKTHIGYLSHYIPGSIYWAPTKIKRFTPIEMIETVLRVYEKIRNVVKAYNIPGATKHGNGETSLERTQFIEGEVRRFLYAHTYPTLDPICDQVLKDMEASCAKGAHHDNKREHVKKQARKQLKTCLNEILKAGVTDEEIHEILSDAICEYVIST